MKRNIFLCILLALTVLSLFCFSACEGGGIYIDTGSGTETDDYYDSDTDDTSEDTSTDTEGGSGDVTDTDTEGGSGNEDDSQGGTGNEGGDQGSGDNSGDDNPSADDTPSGDDNPSGDGNQGGTGNEGDNSGDNGGDDGGDNGGDEGNENPPAPTTYTDADGFVYLEDNGELYCVDFVRPVDATQVVYMPSEYQGKPVVGIRTNAFTDFGVAFGQSEFKNASYYYTIAIPRSIKVVEAAAFDLCWGIRICLYSEVQDGDKVNYRLLDSSMKNDLAIILDWESNLTLFDRSEKSNRQARDSIWGFRPALGWSRYSAVEIPDFYE